MTRPPRLATDARTLARDAQAALDALRAAAAEAERGARVLTERLGAISPTRPLEGSP